MGFYRLLKGELNKILMRPILYVITFIVIIAIIFSTFQYNPTTRNEFTKYYSVYGECETVLSVDKVFKQASNPYGVIEADQLVDKASQNLEKAYLKDKKTQPGELTIKEYLYYLIGMHQSDKKEETVVASFFSAYDFYMNEQNFKTQSVEFEIQWLVNVIGPLQYSTTNPNPNYTKNNLTELKTYIIENLGSQNILMQKQVVDELDKLYKTVNETIISENRPSEYDALKKENHTSIRKLFKELKIKIFVEEMAEDVGLKSISDKLYEERTKSIEKAQENLIALRKQIDDVVAEADELKLSLLKDLCVKYYLYALNTHNLISNTVTYSPVLEMGDSKVKDFYGYDSKDSADSIYLYSINENMSRQLYLLNNFGTENEFATVFNANKTSNQDINAFDFVYFGLEITSIVIIIFTVVLAAGMLAGEQSTGTLKLLLIRPYSRSKILTSKLLATIIFASIFLIFSTIVLFLIGWALYGVSFTPILAVFNGTSAFVISPVLMLIIYLLCILLKAIVFIVISLAISAIFRSNVGAVSISIVLYFLISIMGTIFATSFWYGFLPFSNLDMFKFFGGSFITSNSGGSLLTSIFSSSIFHGIGFYYSLAINLAVIAILTISSYFIFKKREIK